MSFSLCQPSCREFHLQRTLMSRSIWFHTRLQTTLPRRGPLLAPLSSLTCFQLRFWACLVPWRAYLCWWSTSACSWTNRDLWGQRQLWSHLLIDRMSTSNVWTFLIQLCPRSWPAPHHPDLLCMMFGWSRHPLFVYAVIQTIACRISSGLMSFLPSHHQRWWSPFDAVTMTFYKSLY